MTDPIAFIDDELVMLDNIAMKVLNITPRIAQRKAAAGTLPFRAFRINGGHRGPLYVRKQDVQAHVAAQAGVPHAGIDTTQEAAA